MPDIVTNVLYAEIDRLRARVKELEEENRYLRAGCQDDTHQCPIVGTNNTLIERIAELEAENKRLMELVDGAKEIVEIANCTSPAQCKWKVEWMQKASKPRRRQAMNEEQMKLDRIQYWSECSTEEKLERTRKAVKQLQRDVALLNKFMRYLQTHSHLPDGSVVIPLFMKDEPQLNSLCFPETGDKVYF